MLNLTADKGSTVFFVSKNCSLSFSAYFFWSSLNRQQCRMLNHVQRPPSIHPLSGVTVNHKFIFPGYSQLSHNKGIKAN